MDKTLSKIDQSQLSVNSTEFNAKDELESLPRDFAILDFPCDERYGKPNSIKKTKVE